MRTMWTKEELDELLILIAQGKTNEQIAAKLGRTKVSVAHKRSRLFKEAEAAEGNVSGLFEGTVGALTAEAEEPEEEGTTELERELCYAQKLLDELTNTIKDNAEIIDSNIAAMIERTSALDHENTVLRDRVEALEKDLLLAREDLNAALDYLTHSTAWRIFHGFRRFREGRQE